MAPVPASGPIDFDTLPEVEAFVRKHYGESGAALFGIDAKQVAGLLVEVASHAREAVEDLGLERFLESLKLEELVLVRACIQGNNSAWEIFLTRYRSTLYDTAYKIAKEESAARALADSLYAELYGVNDKGEQRPSKLLYYGGRGSLQGWLRAVIAQDYVKQYRRTLRETSLEAAVEDGKQFEAVQQDATVLDPRLDAATQEELAALQSDERFLLAAYYLDRRTLADIAKLLRVHESTVSRKLDRIAAALGMRIRKRLVHAGMSSRQAEEAIEGVDVRDLRLPVAETLRQGTQTAAFYKEKSGDEG